MKRFTLFGIVVMLLVAPVGKAEEPKEIASFKHELRVGAVAFSPSGKTLATATAGGLPLPNEVKLWDVATKKESDVRIKTPDDLWISLAFSPDGRYLATSGFLDRTARIWDMTTHKTIATVKVDDVLSNVALSPDGTTLATASYDKTARLYDVSFLVKPKK